MPMPTQMQNEEQHDSFDGREGFQDHALIAMKNTTFLTCVIVAWAFFIPFSVFIPEQHLFEVINAVIVGGCVAIDIGYAALAWRKMRMPPHRLTGADSIIITRFLGCFFLTFIFGLQWYWRAFDYPEWAISSYWAAFTRYGLATTLILALMTTYTRRGRITRTSIQWSLILVSVMVGVSGTLIYLGLG